MPIPVKLYFSADHVLLGIPIILNLPITTYTIITVYRIYDYFTEKCPVCPLYARTYKTLFQRRPYVQFAHFMPVPIKLYFSADLMSSFPTLCPYL